MQQVVSCALHQQPYHLCCLGVLLRAEMCFIFGTACCMPDMLNCPQEPAQWQTQSQGTYRTDFNADPAHYTPLLPQGRRAQLVGSARTTVHMMQSAACQCGVF